MTPEETIDRLRERLANNAWTLKPGDREQIDELFNQLQNEIDDLAEQAAGRESIHGALGLADSVAHQQGRETTNENVLRKTFEALEEALEEVAITHPRVASLIRALGKLI